MKPSVQSRSSSHRKPSRRPIGLLVGAVGFAAAGLAWSSFALTQILFPRIDDPAPTDAVYILASPGGTYVVEHPEILPMGVPVLVSVTGDRMQTPAYQSFCAQSHVTCVVPDPLKTRGEARNLGIVAHERGWRSVTVYTHRSHISRSRMMMERCFDGEVRMTSVDVEKGLRARARSLAYETGGWTKAIFMPGCPTSR